ncbi:MAG: AAA family ATPase, partial [Lachnospiraceae bacterium]|nr:AAA family ATPase [Lachnospiraceae bacterium]
LDTINSIKEIIEYAKQNRPDYVLVSGDIIDSLNVYGPRALVDEIEAERLLSELSQYTECLVVLRGTPNHDGAADFEALKQHFINDNKVHIVSEPGIVQTDKLDIACLPGFDRGYFRSQNPEMTRDEECEKFATCLHNITLGLKASCRQDRPAVLMAHYYVPGTDAGSGGSFIKKFEPTLMAETLNSANFDLVALGHIHRPQQLSNIRNCFYSGAVNRFTFNDEGFPRGFYMHTINDDKSVESQLVPLKAREFVTVRLNDEDIGNINAGLYDVVAPKWHTSIKDAIVRVRYSCSEDKHKALNHRLLQKRLYEDGAFYVPDDIIPEDITKAVDRKAMDKEEDPEKNLIEYLTRKGFSQEDIGRLSGIARAIIAKASTEVTAAAFHGVFTPIKIEVENYRNYAKESFDFSDITFCTINGENGAGKSSLFMDAIIDCLYEEPREGSGNLSKDCPWIRRDEAARSGTIIFTFAVGDKTFRVSRSRSKSGSGKLNLAELVEGEWINRSSEKMNGTQASILQILGMDSMTFKSCALIMQDQYGIFLQATPKDRMRVMSNLLGLGIYESMSRIAAENKKEAGNKKKEADKEREVQEENINTYCNPEEELNHYNNQLATTNESLKQLTEEEKTKALEVKYITEAKERADKLLNECGGLRIKRNAFDLEVDQQQKIIEDCDLSLDHEDSIRSMADKYRNYLEKDKELIEGKTIYIQKKNALEQNMAEAKKLESELSQLEAEKDSMEIMVKSLSDTSEDELIKSKAKEYDEKQALYEQLKNKQLEFSEKRASHSMAMARLNSKLTDKENVLKSLEAEKKVLERKTELLSSSGCIDVNNANCKFLQDAKEAEKQLLAFPEKIEETNRSYDEEIRALKVEAESIKNELDGMDFNEDEVETLNAELFNLKPYKNKLEELQQKELKISSIKASLEAKHTNISNLAERLNTVKREGTELELEVGKYKAAYDESESVKLELANLKKWIDEEQQLPVLKERKASASARLKDLQKQMEDVDKSIVEKQKEYADELLKATGIEEKRLELGNISKKVSELRDNVAEIQTKIGRLTQQIEDIAVKREQIKELVKDIEKYSKLEADYEVLKEAFSQNGIPHQIVMSILPELSDTSNTILAQMTGGKMGVDFKTETINTSKKEEVTLDILISEYGKDTLPYLSKSGGEKVKASLAVILALAEIKSNTAGMQLGMLFIDEPPFLDADGIQAYCDALVTIQFRYPDLKVMAITHDPTMKARFSQNIDIFKTNDGSKVRYN